MNLLVILGVLVSLTHCDDGCSDPIRSVSVLSVSGSTGYSILCPNDPSSITIPDPDEYEQYEHMADDDYVALHEGKKSKFRHGKGPFPKKHHRQRHLGLSSLIQTGEDSTRNICFVASKSADDSATSNVGGYAEIGLDAQYVIRDIVLADGSVENFYHPDSFTVSSLATPSSSSANWYVSLGDADSGTPWTVLGKGSTVLSTDFAGQSFRIFPKTATSGLGGNAFAVQLRGCAASSTALVSFRFKASLGSITSRFGKMSAFIESLTDNVCLMTKLTKIATPCSRVVFASIQESLQASGADGTLFKSVQVPTVEVYFRILPANVATCSDCRDAATIQANLLTDLASPTSAGAALLRAIDTWIEDADPFMCYQKTCPYGTLCVSGACVTPSEIAATQAEGTSLETEFASADEIDKILNLSPLNVIDGIDQTAGRIVFNQVPAVAGVVHSTHVVATPSTTSDDESFMDRYLIPIIILSSILGIVLVLLGYKVWERSQMTPAARAATA